jgi:UDP-N-acetylglucosamine enolpyruvyl transferase
MGGKTSVSRFVKTPGGDDISESGHDGIAESVQRMGVTVSQATGITATQQHSKDGHYEIYKKRRLETRDDS